VIRRVVLLAVVVVAFGGLAASALMRDDSPRVVPTFSAVPAPLPPRVPQDLAITSSWFCPGVPSGGEGRGGSVVVANPAETVITGRLTVFSDAASEPVEERFSVAARDQVRFDLPGLQPQGTMLGALVEVDGGGGLVEQEARHPDGSAVSPCANKPSSQWFFADGYTFGGSTSQLIITNPYADEAVVEIDYATPEKPFSFASLDAFIVKGRSVLVVDQQLMPKDEKVLAAKIIVSRGRVVAGRAQTFSGGERTGFTLALGAPSLTTQVYFADGEAGNGITESYAVYNPTDQDISVTPSFFGIPLETSFVFNEPFNVPAGRVVSFAPADIPNLPVGRHGLSFSTLDVALVVERVITRPAGDGFVTSVVPGMFGTLSYRWSTVIGPTEATEAALVVMSTGLEPTTVTVSALNAGGVAPVPGLDSVTVPPNGGITTIDLIDPAAVGVPLIIDSTQPVFIERVFRRGGELAGRSGSYALPG
jgi:hypothetical protein